MPSGAATPRTARCSMASADFMAYLTGAAFASGLAGVGVREPSMSGHRLISPDLASVSMRWDTEPDESPIVPLSTRSATAVAYSCALSSWPSIHRPLSVGVTLIRPTTDVLISGSRPWWYSSGRCQSPNHSSSNAVLAEKYSPSRSLPLMGPPNGASMPSIRSREPSANFTTCFMGITPKTGQGEHHRTARAALRHPRLRFGLDTARDSPRRWGGPGTGADE